MFNRERTVEEFGYDIDSSVIRKSMQEQALAPGIKRKDMKVVDNCPSCNVERIINYKQSQKNTVCPKCFHSTPEMQEAKRNQVKTKSEETKQKMRENHWSTKGLEPAFKGQKHTQENIDIIRASTVAQYTGYSDEQRHLIRVKDSCTKRGISIENFDGFSAPEGTRIRQSAEGKAWSLDVLQKANFTCQKCDIRGGKLHAHHKNGFNAFPEQRFDIENGACLCYSCHEEFHRVYGKGDNTVEQFEGWINVNA